MILLNLKVVVGGVGTISVGSVHIDGDDLETLITAADSALLLVAKHSGRDRVVFAPILTHVPSRPNPLPIAANVHNPPAAIGYGS